MRNFVKLIPASFVAVSFILAFPAEATFNLSKKEKNEPCSTCHAPAPPKLSPVGECYKRKGHKDLDVCKKDPSSKSVSPVVGTKE